jgi:RNA polymerase nonessential primary-like sigma factor
MTKDSQDPMTPLDDAGNAERTESNPTGLGSGVSPDGDVSGDALSLYLRGVRRSDLFTPEEEFDTATRARAGDFSARQAWLSTTCVWSSALPKGTADAVSL